MNFLKFICIGWLTLPHIIAYELSPNKKLISLDIDRWSKDCKLINKFVNPNIGAKWLHRMICLVWLLATTPEFRNLFYMRIKFLKIFCLYLRPLSTLYIATKSENFGAGTYIQHGFSTVITAEHIGRNCWINQQVTIGYNDSKTRGYGKPWIGDNVRISAGAKVCGPVKIGDNCIIGVNAVIVKDVPSNSIVIPSPMMMIQENGERVYKKL